MPACALYWLTAGAPSGGEVGPYAATRRTDSGPARATCRWAQVEPDTERPAPQVCLLAAGSSSVEDRGSPPRRGPRAGCRGHHHPPGVLQPHQELGASLAVLRLGEHRQCSGRSRSHASWEAEPAIGDAQRQETQRHDTCLPHPARPHRTDATRHTPASQRSTIGARRRTVDGSAAGAVRRRPLSLATRSVTRTEGCRRRASSRGRRRSASAAGVRRAAGRGSAGQRTSARPAAEPATYSRRSAATSPFPHASDRASSQPCSTSSASTGPARKPGPRSGPARGRSRPAAARPRPGHRRAEHEHGPERPMPPTVLQPAGFGERLSTGGVRGGAGMGLDCGFTTVCSRTGESHDGHIMGTAASSWEA